MSVSSVSSVAITISLNDLLYSAEYFSHLEATNKQVFNKLDYDVLKINLLSWVGQGYPDAYTVFTFPVVGIKENGLYKCSDSTSRSLEDYVPFFLTRDLAILIAEYQAKIGGIRLSHSFGEKCVNILASKP